jgi:heat shock protein HtpX
VDAERAANQRWGTRAYALVSLGVGVLASLVAVAFSLAAAIAILLVIAGGLFFVLRRQAPAAVVRAIGASPLEQGQLPRVETLLEGLSVTVGVALPSLSILVDEIPNATSLSTREGPVLVLTTGLVNSLSVIELEGVLAHLLAHQRVGSNDRGTKAAGLALVAGRLGRSQQRAHGLCGRGRLLRADEVGVLGTRFPPGLAAALGRMEQSAHPVPGSFFASETYKTLRWLFIDPSIGLRALSDEVGNLDATGVRRRVLQES